MITPGENVLKVTYNMNDISGEVSADLTAEGNILCSGVRTTPFANVTTFVLAATQHIDPTAKRRANSSQQIKYMDGVKEISIAEIKEKYIKIQASAPAPVATVSSREKNQDFTLLQLIETGLLEPGEGVLSLTYTPPKGQSHSFLADLHDDGSICWKKEEDKAFEKSFSSPRAFVRACMLSVNPTASSQAGNRWAVQLKYGDEKTALKILKERYAANFNSTNLNRSLHTITFSHLVTHGLISPGVDVLCFQSLSNGAFFMSVTEEGRILFKGPTGEESSFDDPKVCYETVKKLYEPTFEDVYAHGWRNIKYNDVSLSEIRANNGQKLLEAIRSRPWDSEMKAWASNPDPKPLKVAIIANYSEEKDGKLVHPGQEAIKKIWSELETEGGVGKKRGSNFDMKYLVTLTDNELMDGTAVNKDFGHCKIVVGDGGVPDVKLSYISD